jgi:hypothetical protein
MNMSSTGTFEDDKFVLHHVKFLILISLQIPSILLSILIFTFFFTHRTVLRNLQNQALLVLLVVNFVQVTCDLPMPIQFYRLGYISPATAAYCTWWTFFEFSLNVASEYLMGAISIQRHMLVFKSRLLQVRWKRFLFYHFPLLFCVLYPIIFYLIVIVFYPCDGTQWDFTSNACGFADCYLVYNEVLSTYDWVVNNGLPTVVILLSDLILVIRVVRQKRRQRRAISWRKQRRMTLQLLSISCLYMIAWLPSMIIAVIQQVNSLSFLAQIQSDYILDLTYIVCLFIPWVCLGLLPGLLTWMRNGVCLRQRARNVVAPAQLPHERRHDGTLSLHLTRRFPQSVVHKTVTKI